MKRRTKVWVAVVVVLVLIVVGPIAWYYHENFRRPRAEYLALIAELRAQGHPVTPDDLRNPPIPDEENAAFLYEAAFMRLDELTQADRKCCGSWTTNKWIFAN